jgi:DNA-binding response OmpR family regulator
MAQHVGPDTVETDMVAQNLDILVCDDELSLREALRESFEREGHRVLAVPDGRSAIDVALGPASPNGYEVCRTLRDRRNNVPIIMLTALDSEADAVLGLEAGADDYVVKPFRPAELRSRIRAVLRRVGHGGRVGAALTAGALTLDPGPREVHRDGELVALTFSEFELLHALMADRGRVHSRHDLLRAIWGDSAYRDPRAIDVHVRHLREKLEAVPEDPQLIITVRGAGYRIGEP